MRYKILIILFLAGLCLAQMPALYVDEVNDNIYICKGCVRWYEFKLVNTRDRSFENIKVVINYDDGVRPLRDPSWRGRKGLSHREYTTKDEKSNRIIVDFPSLRPHQTEEISLAFVGQRENRYDFNTLLYTRDDSGNWVNANYYITQLEEREMDEQLEARRADSIEAVMAAEVGDTIEEEIGETESGAVSSAAGSDLMSEEDIGVISRRESEVESEFPTFMFFAGWIVSGILIITAIIILFRNGKKKGKKVTRKVSKRRTEEKGRYGGVDFEFVPDLEGKSQVITGQEPAETVIIPEFSDAEIEEEFSSEKDIGETEEIPSVEEEQSIDGTLKAEDVIEKEPEEPEEERVEENIGEDEPTAQPLSETEDVQRREGESEVVPKRGIKSISSVSASEPDTARLAALLLENALLKRQLADLSRD